VQYVNGNNITANIIGLNRSIPYISLLTIDHTNNIYDQTIKRVLWWGDKTVFPGFEDSTPDIKLWVASGTVLLFSMIATISTALILGAFSIVLAFVFLSIGWFDPLNTTLLTVLFIIVAVFYAFMFWKQQKKEI